MRELGCIADNDRDERGIYRGDLRVLIEELSEGLERTQNTNAGNGCQKDIAVRRDRQGVRFVDSTSKRFVDICRVSGILLDSDAGDVCF